MSAPTSDDDGPTSLLQWLFATATNAIAALPGMSLVRRRIDAIEHAIGAEIQRLLDQVERDRAVAAIDRGGEPVASRAAGSAETPGALLAQLYERALDHTLEESQSSTFLSILRQLVPDEARILGALSDGDGHAVVHVVARASFGSAVEQVLSDVSAVGQAAGIQWRDMTPHYVGHLRLLGLVEAGAEDPALSVKYELLEGDTLVRVAVGEIEGKRMKPRVIRRTLRLTRLGRELLTNCQSIDGAPPTAGRVG